MKTLNGFLTPIVIKETKNADTRFTESMTLDNLTKDTMQHIFDVSSTMIKIADYMKTRAALHDFTKMKNGRLNQGFLDAMKTGKTGKDFYDLPWWKIHKTEERHHELDGREDVDLIDIIEMVSDCVVAGKARSGTVFPIRLKDETLQRALKNTVEAITAAVKVKE